MGLNFDDLEFPTVFDVQHGIRDEGLMDVIHRIFPHLNDWEWYSENKDKVEKFFKEYAFYGAPETLIAVLTIYDHLGTQKLIDRLYKVDLIHADIAYRIFQILKFWDEMISPVVEKLFILAHGEFMESELQNLILHLKNDIEIALNNTKSPNIQKWLKFASEIADKFLSVDTTSQLRNEVYKIIDGIVQEFEDIFNGFAYYLMSHGLTAEEVREKIDQD